MRIRSQIQVDNSALNIAIENKIEKLQADLATDNNLMDKLAQKTKKVKVLSVKLNYANRHLHDLGSEKIVLKSCVSDVNLYLQNLIEIRDSLLIVSVRQHLTKKLKPVFIMLKRIEGVSESDALLKQG